MFLSDVASRRRLPVVLLSGFLGSGKTTLVNALLKDTRLAETAVAINEFGAIPLDQHLIETDADKTVVLANGCLCCNVAGDMEDAVLRIFSRRQDGSLPTFQRMIIEPSGLADPAPIAQAILRNPIMSRVMRLEGVITTVDAVFGEVQIARHPETRKQISLADTLVVTKTDLAPSDDVRRLKSRLRDLNPLARLIEADHGQLDAELLLPKAFLDPTAPAASGPHPAAGLTAEAADPGHTSQVAAVCLTADRPLNWRAVERFLQETRIAHAERLLRLKGLLNLAQARGPVVVQGVHHVMHPPVELPTWPDADRRSRIILIVQTGADGVDPEALSARWDAALPSLIAEPVCAA